MGNLAFQCIMSAVSKYCSVCVQYANNALKEDTHTHS